MDLMDPLTILCDIFTNKSKEVIENVIHIVEENMGNGSGVSDEEKLEIMINLLSETGTSENSNSSINHALEEDNLSQEGAGSYVPKTLNNPRDDISDTLKRLMEIFPDADPSYLEKNALNLANNNPELETFINNHMENKNYPTMGEYLKRKTDQSEMDKYLFHFRLYEFLLEFPNPLLHFTSAQRKHAFSNYEENKNFNVESEFALNCLYNQFGYLRKADIQKIFRMCNRDIVKSYYRLKKLSQAFRSPRNHSELPNICITNVALLQEIAFIQNEEEIEEREKEKQINFRRAKQLGLLETCGCCCTEDLIPEDCFLCKSGCKFCKECIRKAAEIAYAEGKTEFKCLSDCGSEYTLPTLQMVLNPKTFFSLCHRMQMQEVTNADIDGLECCPLCSDFVMIPDPNDKIFHCDKCQKDSCRECKHEAHVPLRCNEIEYDEDVKMRTFIENKMTDALLRKCPQCSKTFIKNTGCNKITCSCGTKMCYLCRIVITDYSHFSGTGCRLFTNDEEIHLNNVIRGANAAKAELGVDKNPEKLKIDPTKNL